MSDLKQFEAVYLAAKSLYKKQADVEAKSDKFTKMGFNDYSAKARAAASDRVTIAAFERDKAKDLLHKHLVDAFLVAPNERSSYETRLLCHSHGFGHSVKFKYTPPLPKCYE